MMNYWFWDSFIKVFCCSRTWHFLTLNLPRSDTNVFMSFKLVYKSGRVRPLALKPNVQVLTWLAWTHRWVLNSWWRMCRVLKMYEEHCLSFLTVTTTPRENTVQIVWSWRSGSERKLFAVQAYKAIPPSVPGERAQKEMNLRYQFAEFCSIDGSLEIYKGQQSQASKQNYLRMATYSLCLLSCLKETGSLCTLHHCISYEWC